MLNRIANRLSERPKTAGATSVHLSTLDTDVNCDESTSDAHYTIGQQYGGDAQSRVKSFGQNRGRPHRGHNSGVRPTQRIIPQWLRGVRGCFVCGKDHLVRHRHPCDEITRAIDKLKAKAPMALLTVSDLAAIQAMQDDDPAQ